ncbi:MarR family winged helix-turn-helix transcriptional regulator [Rhizobium sp. CSW-27]|uniref:MarR family winged helix-turn-helix transcriptional regulator n=1 Tax=Rhizobium sp. CSW-27 TaxID=2839985 RepID=UPI001C0199F8|nr:MarR family winged helix-turn-helix transcriptional regulator [Rhizobium sp. CSW-27]MBT9371752.1 MarR family winged helix-turn-helix transcriptional regulator [Rhizobium sp. CSW-27]
MDETTSRPDAMPEPETAAALKDIRQTLSQLVGYHLRRASVYDMNGAVAALEPVDARPITMSVLTSIVEQPGRTSADICRMLAIKRANIVGLLQALEARGLFTRRDDPADQRLQRLYPTPEGVAAARQWLHLVQEHENRILSRLSLAERAELRRLLALVWADERAEEG